MTTQGNISSSYCTKCNSIRTSDGYCTATNDPNCKYKYIQIKETK